MKDSTKTKYISDVNNTDTKLKATKPFEVERENQRQFIRLEISTPMSLKKIKDIFGNFWPTEEDYSVAGEILNISAGGVLVDLDQPLNEQDIVSMKFSLQDVKSLDNVLGLVKRVEHDEDCYLTGIEFVTQQQLEDRLSTAEIKLLDNSFDDFSHRVTDVLKQHVYDSAGDQNV